MIQSFKLTAQSFLNHPNYNLNAVKWKLDHKQQFGSIKAKSKINLSTKRFFIVDKKDISTSLSTSVAANNLSLNLKYTDKGEFNSKLSLSRWLGNFKFKTSVDIDSKKDIVYGGNIGFQHKRLVKDTNPEQNKIMFLAQYNEVLGTSLSLRSSLKQKLQLFYKGHFVTGESHKIYLEYKFGYDSAATNKYSNNFTLNCQDSLAIGTFNGSL